MRTIPLITTLVFACIVLASLTMFLPAVAGAALPYASLGLSLSVCVICAVLLAVQLLRR